MKHDKLKIFKIVLYLIYIVSIGYFGISKNFAGLGMSIFCLVTTKILSIAYDKKVEVIDKGLYIVSNLFLLFSILLGSSYEFYEINHYDDFLHFWSGFIGVKIAWNLLKELNIEAKNNKIILFISILLISMGVSSICEVTEYTLDTVFKMKTQSGGLVDTMQDIIDALLGSIIMIGYYLRKIKKIA